MASTNIDKFIDFLFLSGKTKPYKQWVDEEGRIDRFEHSKLISILMNADPERDFVNKSKNKIDFFKAVSSWQASQEKEDADLVLFYIQEMLIEKYDEEIKEIIVDKNIQRNKLVN